MTPSWLTDKAVKVYAAKHLPVVRVFDAPDSPYVWQAPTSTEWWALCHVVNPELRAAWERLLSHQPVVDMTNPPKDALGVCVDHWVDNGLYYLEPGKQRALEWVDLPTLVPCEDVKTYHGAIGVISDNGLLVGINPEMLEDSRALQAVFVEHPYLAALVLHLKERTCESGDEHHGATLPEQLHVETRKDGWT